MVRRTRPGISRFSGAQLRTIVRCCASPRNDEGHVYALAARNAPELMNDPPSKEKRAQGKPGAQCTRSLACKVKKHTSIVTTGSPNWSGLPCAMVYGLWRALPGERALLPPSPALLIADLTPASRSQDHTLLPSASAPLVNGTSTSIASRPTFRDDAYAPLVEAG